MRGYLGMATSSRLAFLGDVMLGRLVNWMLETVEPDYVWGESLPVLRTADARFANLECVLSDWGEPWPGKRFVFRSDSKNVAVLLAAQLTAVSLANNHVLDFGDVALRQTLELLAAAGIGYAGAGRNLSEAMQPATVRVGEYRCAFLAVTDNEPDWEATTSEVGIFFVPCDLADERFQRLLELVKMTAMEHDLVIVSYHWGPNWGERPLPEHVRVGHALIQAGARIVYGHSAHITRAVEFYGDGVILYSCGDFIDDYAVDEVQRNDETFLFLILLEDARPQKVELIPFVIAEFQVRRPELLRAARMCERMRHLCAEFGTVVHLTAQGLALTP